ncbi:alkane hydroxylase MAH1-like [Mercurialis annua]|uniref:alkane hydroxylase MAH1-like n=1 Tax=Mercurialis annua TaxID=3986 RepID=UPI00215E07C7|nr:alkane hydroxylase MAH1-like [Mercurialis annua]
MAILADIGFPIVLISLAFLWFWWCNRKSLHIDWPVFGMFPGLLRSLHRAHSSITYILQQSGGTFLFKGPWFSRMDYLVTSDPAIVHYTLSKNFANYQKGANMKQIFEALGDGIFNVDSDEWKLQRKQIHSVIQHRSFDGAVKRVLEEKILNGLFTVLDNASEQECSIDIQDVFQRFSFDCICMLVLNYDPKCVSVDFPQVPFEKAFDTIEKVIFNRHVVPMSVWKLQRWFQIGEEKKMRKAWETFDHFVEQCISRKQDELINNAQMETENFDLLTYFLTESTTTRSVNVRHPEEEDDKHRERAKSKKYLRDMTCNLLLAGRDTVGAGLVWLIWLIATHPHVENKILDEIKPCLKGANRSSVLVSFEKLNKLVYLHAAICETLRLYPPIPFEVKVPIDEDILPGGHRVSSNIKILYSLYSMGRMEEIWGKDCLEFKPERWISERGEIKHVPSYKFLAFNAGPRSCLGKDLGLMEMKLVASSILWNYCIQVVENHPVNPSLSMVLYMKNGLKVRVSKRHAPSD